MAAAATLMMGPGLIMFAQLIAALLVSGLAQPVPYEQVAGQSAAVRPYQGPSTISAADMALFREGLAAARARDVVRAQDVAARISDPVARKLVEWALIDTAGEQLSYAALAQANVSMADWPRYDSRRSHGEIALERAAMPADVVLSFFGQTRPTTAQGSLALAGALEQTGRAEEARTLIRTWWRDQSFEAPEQQRMLDRFGRWLTQDDHDARLSMLLLGPHGPATNQMLNLASPGRRAIANAHMSLRGAYAPDTVVAGLTMEQSLDPGVVLERVRILRSQSRQSEAFALLQYLPAAPSHAAGQSTLWTERRNYFLDALQLRNWNAAYHAMAGHGFTAGERMVDAEFFAGWVALTKLNDPATAARHFEALRQMSSTPITQGRALYWLGRTAEAAGDTAGAQGWYAQGAQHIQSFYGQLAAEKAGLTTLTLPGDPQPTDADRAHFESLELVRAARIVAEAGETGLFNTFVYHADDVVEGPMELAQLIDMARGYGEWFTSMMIGRAASQRGHLMPERQYPVQIPTAVPGAAPIEFTLAITRQESSFTPRIQSHAGARGMMQFLPSTASGVARRMGLPYSPERLWEADYNMQLGSYHLQELTDQFGGSWLLATVGYNAGPARPPQWVARCGDPRGAMISPPDFIECVPFTETRNYMMRVMENVQIYRARLNGGTAEIRLSEDLARGTGYRSGPVPYQPAQ